MRLTIVTHIWNSHRIRLKYDNSKLDASATMLQLAKMQERKNSLRRRINAWTAIQHLYMPELSAVRMRADQTASETSLEIAPWDLPLHLPSSLNLRSTCLPILQQHEFRLREAQAYEALDELRDRLRLRSHMYKYKDKNVVGQRANTRCQNIIRTVQERIDSSAVKYRTARMALTKLSPHVNDDAWLARLLPLNQDDICPLKECKEGESEGQRSLSWIWRIVGVGGDSADEGLQEGKFIIIIHFSILPTWISDEFGTTSPPHRVVSKSRPGNAMVRGGTTFA
jgi:hypothetical protein